jgi:hypothetical protein
MKLPNNSIDRIKASFSKVDLGDPRRTKRLFRSVAKMAMRPGASLPEAVESERDLEGVYRFANNHAVSPKKLLAAVASTTAKRAKDARSLIVIHDTTTCSFAHADADAVGYLPTGKAGFFAHFSLVIEGDGWRRPLGIAHLETIVRKQRSKRGPKKASGGVTAKWKDRESARWERGIEESAKLLSNSKNVVHVADREGDSYALLASMVANQRSFVIRVNHDRNVSDPDDLDHQWGPLKAHVRGLKGMLTREVYLSERKGSTAPKANKAHPARRARLATLSFTATTVMLKRPNYLRDPIPETLTLNVVHVTEPNPPPGEPAVEWLLFTTLPINTKKQIAAVVDTYRARWTIEEFNKALKTGCAYECREFQSLHALLIMLAMTLPIACELLWLRSRDREQPGAPATQVLTPQQIRILRFIGPRHLPPKPTVRDALWSVAGLGGHVKRNGDPGWLVLYRGMQKLLAYELGYEAGYRAAEIAKRRSR